MKFNFIEIINAWITAANPSEMETKLAKQRLSICLRCPVKKEIIHNKEWSAVCGSCGCPLKAKIFTSEYGSCPEKKWDTIENEYIKHLKIKKKSII